VPFTVLLVAFEVGVAVLVLSKDRRVRVGLLAAVAFMIGLAPLMSWYELANVRAGGLQSTGASTRQSTPSWAQAAV
jgi:hypothetical protein